LGRGLLPKKKKKSALRKEKEGKGGPCRWVGKKHRFIGAQPPKKKTSETLKRRKEGEKMIELLRVPARRKRKGTGRLALTCCFVEQKGEKKVEEQGVKKEVQLPGKLPCPRKKLELL